MGTQTYLVALGGNVWGRGGAPQHLIAALALPGIIARSRVRTSRPLGPARRQFANALVRLESALDPPALLAQLKAIERAHGRRGGQHWGPRPLDLDIIGWSGGCYAAPDLVIPHPAFRSRRFVLAPLVDVAPDWRDPVSGLTSRQLLARHRKPRRI